MSLGVAFKGPEGVVLAADSRVTLNAQLSVPGMPTTLLPATFDNATKLFRVSGQDYVGAVTYGLGAIGDRQPRTAKSFVPEFEEELVAANTGRLGVEAFAAELSGFFMRQWAANMPATYAGPPMIFLIGGFDVTDPYGRVFQFAIPTNPTPVEVSPGEFGATWGGQREYADRIMQGFDDALLPTTQAFLGLSDQQRDALRQHLRNTHAIKIPYQFLSLQDCVDLAIFLIRTTITAQQWVVDVRGVGGAIDVALITRTRGFQFVQQKETTGERP